MRGLVHLKKRARVRPSPLARLSEAAVKTLGVSLEWPPTPPHSYMLCYRALMKTCSRKGHFLARSPMTRMEIPSRPSISRYRIENSWGGTSTPTPTPSTAAISQYLHCQVQGSEISSHPASVQDIGQRLTLLSMTEMTALRAS